jgi:hypothetical protein
VLILDEAEDGQNAASRAATALRRGFAPPPVRDQQLENHLGGELAGASSTS